MVLSKPYIGLYERFNGSAFALSDAKKALNTSYDSAKVIISRLKKQNQLLPVGRGRYVLINPGNYLRTKSLKERNEKLHELILAIYKRFPELRMIALYGSQVTGTADELSDYDVLLIIPGKLAGKITSRREVAAQLEAELKVKVHLTIYSEEAYRFLLISEPHIRFWLNEALFFDESGISVEPKPPIGKIAYLESLSTAGSYLEIASKESELRRKVSYYFKGLVILLMLESSLNLTYDFKQIGIKLEELLGKKVVTARRSRAPVKKAAIKKLSRISKDKYTEIRKRIESLGENESDFYWKEMVGKT